MTKPPYCCPRCGYSYNHKGSMQRHLYNLSRPCPNLSNDILLTDEIKQSVLANRIYRPPNSAFNPIPQLHTPLQPLQPHIPLPPPQPPQPSHIPEPPPEEPPLTTETSTGYIYMIQEREFLQQKNPTFKIGCTVQEPDNQIKRLKAYKKGSRIVLVLAVDKANVRSIESSIKAEFTNRFPKHPDGTEYFTGPEKEMRDIVIQHCT